MRSLICEDWQIGEDLKQKDPFSGDAEGERHDGEFRLGSGRAGTKALGKEERVCDLLEVKLWELEKRLIFPQMLPMAIFTEATSAEVDGGAEGGRVLGVVGTRGGEGKNRLN